jgi:hypothetical protein
MTFSPDSPATAFAGSHCLATGPLAEVALAVRTAERTGAEGPLLVFDDASGRVIDLDLRGGEADVLARLETHRKQAPREEKTKPRGRGRPKLGVVGREVTLLPRHWNWLERQPGSASQAIRRLIDEARRAEKATAGPAARKARAERAYRAMAALAGDLPGYEEALRALFAGDDDAFAERMKDWPADVAAYALRLAGMEEEKE